MYKRLKFSILEDPILENCIGVIGYLFVIRSRKFGSFVPSKFIRPFDLKCKMNIVKWLVDNKYLELLPTEKREEGSQKWKQRAKLYKPLDKLRDKEVTYVQYEEVQNLIINNIHHLNGMSFNHYKYSYLKLGLINNYDYNLYKFCHDDRMVGRHYSVFTKDKEKILKLGFDKPVLISVFNSRPLLLADQLLKAFGKNDLSDFFLKKPIKQIGELDFYRTLEDYCSSGEIEFTMSALGYEYVESFSLKYPKANNLLWKVKNGNKYEGYFRHFQKDLKIQFPKNWKPLQVNSDAPLKRGQPYYRIIYFVLTSREVEIMNQVWNWLRKWDIPFIALFDSIVVDEKNANWAIAAMKSRWENSISKKLRVYTTMEYLEDKLWYY